MPQYDYQNSWFTFKTVCHTDAFSYCIYERGIAHEYVDYVSGTGDIREDLFENVVDCITNGQCQHVANAPPKYVHKARVHVLHIVAAVTGFSQELEIMEMDIENFFVGGAISSQSNLLRLAPYDMAILKDNLGATASEIIKYNPFAMLAISERENEKVHFRRVSFEVLCVENNYFQIFANILANGLLSLDSALEAALKHNRTQIVELIVDNSKWFMMDVTGENYKLCCKLAIKFDKPKYLHKLLKNLSGMPREFESVQTLADCMAYANALERWECKTVLTEFENDHADVGQTDYSEKAKKDILIKRLRRYLNRTKQYEESLTILYPYLKFLPISSVQKAILKLWIKVLCDSVKPVYDQGFLKHSDEAESVEAFITSVVDVNHELIDGSFPLLDLLSVEFMYYIHSIANFRSCLAVYLYQNPDINLHKSAVELGIQADERFYSHMPYISSIHPGTYLIDGKQHGTFGHDDFVLNATAPFLMECGFPVSDNALEMVESGKISLPMEEYDYIQNYAANARSLKVLSRDTPRKHFVGQMTHMFVNSVAMPVRIKDFILLKPLLRILPEELNLDLSD